MVDAEQWLFKNDGKALLYGSLYGLYGFFHQFGSAFGYRCGLVCGIWHGKIYSNCLRGAGAKKNDIMRVGADGGYGSETATASCIIGHRSRALQQNTATPDNIIMQESSYILTLSCPDRMGIVHAVSGFLLEHDANIEEAAQHQAADTNRFFMRVQFGCTAHSLSALRDRLSVFATPFQMQAALHRADQPMPCVIMVSREGHCLNDLLFRWQSRQLHIDIRAIISNHEVYRPLAAGYGLAFHHIPVSKNNKAQAEAEQLRVIEQTGAELVVLARYMQILSDSMCSVLAGRAINIHHSFLPSFKGAKPYHQAHERGVKLIGATAHYVTSELDEGPIIEQDVTRASHADTVQQLVARGKDTETQVLARAVRWHSEHRVLLNEHKTVIFQ